MKTLWKDTLLLWMFSFVKLPLVFWLKPRITHISNQSATVMMRFKRKTKNHVNSMYFGVLCVGAELGAGTLAMHLMGQRKEKFTFVFKDFHAEFLKRFEGDVYFTCEQGDVIQAMLDKAQTTHERQNQLLNVTAKVPSQCGDEIMGKFQLTLSLKMRG